MVAFARGIAMGIAMVSWFVQVGVSWSALHVPEPRLALRVCSIAVPIGGLTGIIALMRRRPRTLGPYIGVALAILLGIALTWVYAAMQMSMAGY